MEWIHVLTMIGGNLAIILPLWLWNRSESNADRREIHQILREMKDEMREEMRDFHGRLLVLEERFLRLKEEK